MKKVAIISLFDWYKARLEPIREVLIDRGYEVRILTTDYYHGEKKRVPSDKKFKECTYVHVPAYKKNMSPQRLYSHIVFANNARTFLKKYKPDVVYSLVPSNYAATICAQYKNKNHKRLILDIIDMWPESMPLGRVKNSPPANIWRNLRDNGIKAADYTITECDLYQKALKSVLKPGRTSTLHLFKTQPKEAADRVLAIINEKKGRESNLIKLGFVGSMNNIIDIDGICHVISELLRLGYQVELHAIGGGESEERFQKAANDTGCKAVFYGKIHDEKEKIEILAPCDLAFNMMKDTLEVGLTIKSIDYFSYGLPLFNNIKGDTWNFVESHDIGINITGEPLNKEQIENMLADGKRESVLEFYRQYFDRALFKEKVGRVFDQLGI